MIFFLKRGSLPVALCGAVEKEAGLQRKIETEGHGSAALLSLGARIMADAPFLRFCVFHSSSSASTCYF